MSGVYQKAVLQIDPRAARHSKANPQPKTAFSLALDARGE
jgi:hypothetical protein